MKIEIKQFTISTVLYNIQCGETRLIQILHEININQMHLLSLSSNIEILYKRDYRLEEH